jgi:hypothetical protein
VSFVSFVSIVTNEFRRATSGDSFNLGPDIDLSREGDFSVLRGDFSGLRGDFSGLCGELEWPRDRAGECSREDRPEEDLLGD